MPGISDHPRLADVLYYGNPVAPIVSAIRDPLFFGELPKLGDVVYAFGVASRRSRSRRSSSAGSTISSQRSCSDPLAGQSGSPRACRADARLVHAPGRALAARVPRDPQAAHAVRGLPPARAVRRGHARAGARARRRRGRDVRGHHAADPRDGNRRRPRRGRGACRRGAGADDGRRRAAARARPRGGGAVHPRGGAARAGGARSRAGARRLLRRPVHGRGLPRRGQADAGVRGHEALHVRLARGLARALREARRDLRGVPARDGRGGRGRGAALRLLGRRAVAGRLRGVRRAVLEADPRGRRRADASTSAPALRTCSRRWPRPAAT